MEEKLSKLSYPMANLPISILFLFPLMKETVCHSPLSPDVPVASTGLILLVRPCEVARMCSWIKCGQDVHTIFRESLHLRSELLTCVFLRLLRISPECPEGPGHRSKHNTFSRLRKCIRLT